MTVETERRQDESEMTIERQGSVPQWLGSDAGYAIGVNHERGGVRVLAPIERGVMREDEALTFPPELSDDTAVMIPILAEALRVWDLLQLEIGAAAVVTQAAPWSPLIELAGSWYGAFPVRVGTPDGEAARGLDHDEVTALSRKLAGYPVVCVVELTGRAEAVDTILEAVPPSSRVVFAGPRQDRFTIDYYMNVHRKGLKLTSTALVPSRAFAPGLRDTALLDRSGRLLSSPARAQACHAALAAAVQ